MSKQRQANGARALVQEQSALDALAAEPAPKLNRHARRKLASVLRTRLRKVARGHA